MPIQIVAVNRQARHDYEVLEQVEAGLALTGTEIKSIRQGKANIREAFARVEDGEMWLLNAHIAQYEAGNRFNHEPTRPRKLLLHRSQIRELARGVNERGLTLVPLSLYLKDGRAKVELALVRGRRQ